MREELAEVRMWSDHVFICVFHWRSVCREKEGVEKKVENEDKCKYKVICLTEGYRRMFL